MSNIAAINYKHWILLEDVDFGRICSVYNSKTNELFNSSKTRKEIIAEIDSMSSDNSECLSTQLKDMDFDRIRVTNVVIAVAETCNLACKYCFANAGTYNNIKRPIIHKNTLDEIWSFICKLNPTDTIYINFLVENRC